MYNDLLTGCTCAPGMCAIATRESALIALVGVYYLRIAARMFAPVTSITVTCQRRKTGWRLSFERYDYRAAQNSGALIPRDGEWMARCAEQRAGALEILSPHDTNLPADINVEGLISWRPAHFSATWLDGGDCYQKLSLRAREGSCEWSDIEYDETLFPAQIRQDPPRSLCAASPSAVAT